jgi:hypothetical protein
MPSSRVKAWWDYSFPFNFLINTQCNSFQLRVKFYRLCTTGTARLRSILFLVTLNLRQSNVLLSALLSRARSSSSSSCSNVVGNAFSCPSQNDPISADARLTIPAAGLSKGTSSPICIEIADDDWPGKSEDWMERASESLTASMAAPVA